MDIFLTASGTRGDVQPALALALGLKAAGHTVRIAAGSNFAAWIEAHGFACVPLLDMEAMMRSPAGVAWAEAGNPFKELRFMTELVNEHAAELTRAKRAAFLHSSNAGFPTVRRGKPAEAVMPGLEETSWQR